MAKNENNIGNLLAGLVIGATAGVVLGLLFAPEDGEKTRKKLKKKANLLKSQAIDEFGHISTTFKETTDNLKQTIKENYDKYKSQFTNNSEETKETVNDIQTEFDALR